MLQPQQNAASCLAPKLEQLPCSQALELVHASIFELQIGSHGQFFRHRSQHDFVFACQAENSGRFMHGKSANVVVDPFHLTGVNPYANS